jgi:imidazole glycerol-phosphate synthase subunit HisH
MTNIGVIDIGSGNFGSLNSALKKINYHFKICKKIEDLRDINKFILPGMGSFPNFMEKLNNQKFSEYLKEQIKNNKGSILGICVGFQALFQSSSELAHTKGLGLIEGNVEIINKKNKSIKLPHVGWNSCSIKKKNLIFNNIKDNQDFYFCHSYGVNNLKDNNAVSETYYHEQFVSAVEKDNIFGVQFHPEKSQLNGLQILKNFCEN